MSTPQDPPRRPVELPPLPSQAKGEVSKLPELPAVQLPSAPVEVPKTEPTAAAVKLPSPFAPQAQATSEKPAITMGRPAAQLWGIAALFVAMVLGLGILAMLFFTPAGSSGVDPGDSPTNGVPPTSTQGPPDTYEQASWAAPLVTSDTQVATITGDDYSVAVFLLAVAPAQADAAILLDDGSRPVIEKGDPVAYLSFIFTNTGETAIPTNVAALSTPPRLSSPEIFAFAVPQDSNPELENELGITGSTGVYSVTKTDFQEGELSWEPGESFAHYGNFPLKGVESIDLYAVVKQLHADGSEELVTQGSFAWKLGLETRRPTLNK